METDTLEFDSENPCFIGIIICVYFEIIFGKHCKIMTSRTNNVWSKIQYIYVFIF